MSDPRDGRVVRDGRVTEVGDLKMLGHEEHRMSILLMNADGSPLGPNKLSGDTYQGKRQTEFSPDRIEMTWWAGELQKVEIHGPRIGVNGNKLQHEAHEVYFNLERLPLWASKLITIARMQDRYLHYMRRY